MGTVDGRAAIRAMLDWIGTLVFVLMRRHDARRCDWRSLASGDHRNPLFLDCHLRRSGHPLLVSRVASLQHQILLFDAAGLGLFAVIGAQKAIDHSINPVMAALMGMLMGIGGGMTRDVLAGDTPFVLPASFMR